MYGAAESFAVTIGLISMIAGFAVSAGLVIVIRHALAKRFQGNVHVLNLISSLVAGILFIAILFFFSVWGGIEEISGSLFSSLIAGFTPALLLFILFEVFAVAHLIAQKIERK